MRKMLFTTILLSVSILLFSEDLNAIKERGSITAGIRKISTAIYVGEEFKDKGFCYDLVSAYAKDLNVDLKLNLIGNFTDYWKKDGNIVFKTQKKVTPDIYEKIDLAADIITITDQRKNYVNMIPFVENSEIFFGRKDLNIKSYDDIRGLRLITLESIGFYQLIQDELNSREIPFVLNLVTVDEKSGALTFISGRKPIPKNGVEILTIPKDAKYSKFLIYNQIIIDNADIGIQDSFSFFLHYFESIAYKSSLKPMMPLNKEIGYLAFTTSYDTEKLNKNLSDFIKKYKKSKEYNELFNKYMGLPYSDYQTLLNLTSR